MSPSYNNNMAAFFSQEAVSSNPSAAAAAPQGETHVMGQNQFASLLMICVPKEALKDMEFSDEKTPCPCVVLKSVEGVARSRGARDGDCVVAFGGRALQRRQKARDLELLARNVEEPEVDVLLWGLRGVDKNYGQTLAVKASTLDMDLGEVKVSLGLGTPVVAVIDASAAKLRRLREQGIERGDVLIGINYEPVKDDEPPHKVAKKLEEHLLLGPV